MELAQVEPRQLKAPKVEIDFTVFANHEEYVSVRENQEGWQARKGVEGSFCQTTLI